MEPVAFGEVERREAGLLLVGMGPRVEEEEEEALLVKVTWLEPGRREAKWEGEVEERPDCIVEAEPREELVEGEDPELDEAG